MSREIKFRAWFNGEMVSMGGFIGLSDFFLIINENAELMQYTGLKDVAGRDLFESDIVAMKYSYPSSSKWAIGIVEYKAPNFTVDEKTNNWPDYYEFESLEVIGNIYENPELLDKPS